MKKTYYLKGAGSNPRDNASYIIIKCLETGEERIFNETDIEYKLQHSYYRQNLDNDKWKYLFHMQDKPIIDKTKPIDFSEVMESFERTYKLAEDAITHPSLLNKFSDEGHIQEMTLKTILECIKEKKNQDI